MNSSRPLGRLDHAVKFILSEIPIGRIVCLSRNNAPNASTWIRTIASATRDQVNMAVHYRLAGDCAAVDPNVKAQDGGVLSEKKNACLDNKLVTGACLGGSEVKVVGCMTALGSRAINLAMFTRSL